MAQYWFKCKSCGWGFGFPMNLQGWCALIIFLGLIVLSFYSNNMFEASHTVKDVIRNMLDVIVLSCVFVYVVQDKVEGGVKWR